MGTEVIRPQDCLIERMRISGCHVVFPRRSPGKPRSGRKPATRPESKKRSPEPLRRLVMGQVTILRRGESLPEKKIREHSVRETTPMTVAGEIIVCGTDPATLLVFRADIYAGSAFHNSPAPSDLPLPRFSRMKIDDSATKDLRRLLRLE